VARVSFRRRHPAGRHPFRVQQANWWSPSAAWWAKLNHAKKHRDELQAAYSAYRALDPVQAVAEPMNDNGEVPYRLLVSAEVPLEISLLIGDILHDLRSALDSIMFAMVTNEATRKLTDEEKQACQLPICESPAKFKKFCRSRTMTPLLSQRLRDVLRTVQPFYWTEQAKRHGAAQGEAYADSSRLEVRWAIQHLNNIDKHRQLAGASWSPDIIDWMTDEPDHVQTWRRSGASYTPGAIVGYAMTDGTTTPEEVVHDFNLVLTDLPEHPTANTDVMTSVGQWITSTDLALRQLITGWLSTRPSV